jgi:peroxiredoxin
MTQPHSGPIQKLKPGQVAPDFALPDTQGNAVRLSDLLKSYRLCVVLFICNHCPYVQAYVPRLIQMQHELSKRGVTLVGINSNDSTDYPEDSPEKMKHYAQDWGLNFPYLHDADQRVADGFGAQRTPEIFLLDADRVVRYEGGIDDCYQNAARVTRRPLLDAINDLLAGRPVAQPTTFAIGCSLKRKHD